MSLRWKLSFWYALIFVFMGCVLAVFLYWQTRNVLVAEIDSSLKFTATQISAANQDVTQSTLETILIGTDPDLYVQIINFSDQTKNIQTAIEVDELDDLPIVTPTDLGFFSDDGWRIYQRQLDATTSLSVAHSLQSLETALTNIFLGLLWGVPVFLGLAVAGGYLLSARLLRPVHNITTLARTISTTDFSQRVEAQDSQDEIGLLAKTFNEMLDRLEQNFLREKRFTSDAAHELRTPLTALRGQIDVALSQNRNANQYKTTLTDMSQQVSRLINLSKQLLLLTRLDTNAASAVHEAIDAEDFFAALIDQMQPLAEERQLQLSQQANHAVICGHLDLLIQLFLNLIDNAIKYNPAGTTISLSAKPTADGVELRVQDNGVGIAPEHLPNLFDRFYRADQSRSRDDVVRGSGLGLSLSRQIALFHKGSLSVESQVGKGTIFICILPNC